MRVVGQDRPAVLGVPAGDDPLVGAGGVLAAVQHLLQQRDLRGRGAVAAGEPGGGGEPGPVHRRGPGGAVAGRRPGRVRHRRGGAERRVRDQVGQVERAAVDPGRRPAGHVRLQLRADVRVQVEGQLEGHQLADHDGVHRGPRRDRGQLQRAVLRRQRGAGRQLGVDPRGVRGHRVAQPRRAPPPRTARRPGAGPACAAARRWAARPGRAARPACRTRCGAACPSGTAGRWRAASPGRTTGRAGWPRSGARIPSVVRTSRHRGGEAGRGDRCCPRCRRCRPGRAPHRRRPRWTAAARRRPR